MRRLIVPCLGLTALAVLFMVSMPCSSSWMFAPARTAIRLTARVFTTVVPAAIAQEVLEFKPIPAESAAALEARRARRRAQRDAERARTEAPSTLPAPAAPAVPPDPEPAPEPTRVELSRSGNIMRVGNDITIEEDQTVAGDVLAVGGDVNVMGHVEGDVVSMGGDIRLESTARVDGDVVCMGGNLHEEDGAVVGGQRVTAAGGRETTKRRVEERVHGTSRGLVGAIIWALITFGVAWAFASIAPGRTAAAVEMVKREPGAATVVGFLTLLLAGPLFLVIIILGVLLCITIIGIPLALAAWCAYGLLIALTWVWGYVVGVTVLGQGVIARRSGSAASLASAPGAGLSAPPAGPSLVRAALIGVAVFSGAFLVSRMFKVMPGFGGLGTLIGVLSWIGTGVFTMVGVGALVRGEWQSGSLLRRFRRKPLDTGSGAAPPPPQWYPSSAPSSPAPGPVGPPEPPPVPPAGSAPPPYPGA